MQFIFLKKTSGFCNFEKHMIDDSGLNYWKNYKIVHA